MSKPVPDWVKVGAEVVEVRSGWGPVATFGSVRKISKVLGNGNFRIEGDDAQWRPIHNGASRAGGDSWSNRSIRHVTEELRGEIAQAHRYQRSAKVVADEAKRLDSLARSGDGDRIIAEAERIDADRKTRAALASEYLNRQSLSAIEQDDGEGWQDIASAPTDRAILLFGSMLPHDEIKSGGRLVFTGYWDTIDEQWCTTGSTWTGPFFEPSHWRPLPQPPTPADSKSAADVEMKP